MSSKVDQSLLEVWEMKENVYNKFIKSEYDNFLEFFEKEMMEIRKKYNLKYRNEKEKLLVLD